MSLHITAASILTDTNRFRSCDYELNHGPWEPFSGGAFAVSSLFYNVLQGFGEIASDIDRFFTKVGASKEARHGVPVQYSTQNSNHGTKSRLITPAKEPGVGSVKGTARILKATLRSPMAFTLALAQGAHNAPRLWGDKTVREQDKVTGLRSGLTVAGKVYRPTSFIRCSTFAFHLPLHRSLTNHSTNNLSCHRINHFAHESSGCIPSF